MTAMCRAGPACGWGDGCGALAHHAAWIMDIGTTLDVFFCPISDRSTAIPPSGVQ